MKLHTHWHGKDDFIILNSDPDKNSCFVYVRTCCYLNSFTKTTLLTWNFFKLNHAKRQKETFSKSQNIYIIVSLLFLHHHLSRGNNDWVSCRKTFHWKMFRFPQFSLWEHPSDERKIFIRNCLNVSFHSRVTECSSNDF